MSSRKAVKKPEKKRRALPKKEEAFDSGKVELTPLEQRTAKRNAKILQQIKTPLEQLSARVGLTIEAIENSDTPIDFMRTMFGTMHNSPSNIYCKERSAWLDICICHYLCKVQCSRYTTGRYLCRALRCDSEFIQECQLNNSFCKPWVALSQFPYRYVMAYAPLKKINDEEKEVINKLELPPPEKKKKKKKKRKAVRKAIT